MLFERASFSTFGFHDEKRHLLRNSSGADAAFIQFYDFEKLSA